MIYASGSENSGMFELGGTQASWTNLAVSGRGSALTKDNSREDSVFWLPHLRDSRQDTAHHTCTTTVTRATASSLGQAGKWVRYPRLD